MARDRPDGAARRAAVCQGDRAIDADLTAEEQLTAGGLFIFLAFAMIVLLVGALLRSYWAATVVAVSLSLTLLFCNGILAIVSTNMGSALVVFILPITLIAFGVDFFIHASGRVREEQVDGVPRDRAYPRGMAAVFSALTLAATTSIAAFLSNAFSGIESIMEFGIAAAIGLAIAYLILGWVAPKALLAIEARVGPNPADRSPMIGHKLGFLVVTLIAGIVVSLTAMMPQIGAVALLVLPSLLIVVTPRSKGPERDELEAAVTKGEFDYDPHARGTATRTPRTE
jgi:uncharacterized membrane protein YdfJ with MMPL/SSD domain